MKNARIIILILFVISNLKLLSNVLITSDTIKVDSTHVKYFYNNFNNYTLGNIEEIDTTTLLTSYYSPLDKKYSLYQTLSNSGLANRNISLSYPFKLGFNTELESFSQNIRTADDIIFPIIHQPFSEIKYMMGGNKEQHLEILFSREFIPNLFVTLNYDIDFSPGIYKRTKTHNSFFDGNIRYNTKNNRYGITGYYFLNKLDLQENGGIVNDSIFNNNIETDRSIIDVNLNNATNLIKVSGFGINQYFNILSPNKKTKEDTTTIYKNRKIDIGRINYAFNYQSNHAVYQDEDPISIFYHNYDKVLDSTLTFDSVYFHTIENELYWNTLGYKKYSNDIPFYLSFGIKHSFTYHAGFRDYNTNEWFNKQRLSNLSANADIIINLFKSTRISGNSEIITNGYHAGDFVINGQWKQFLGTYKKNIGALTFNVNLNRQSADWFEEYYYSNNFRWNNNFNPTTTLIVQGSYELPFLTIGIKNTTINNYIYFGTNVKPEQHSGALNISSLYSTFDVKINKYEFVGFASLQTTDNNDIIHIPSFQAKAKFAYNITLVKNISMMQPSIIINYFTEYYADAYMPALRTFYLQNDTKVGNFPYIDLCVTFKIKRANIFVQYTNMYSLTKDYRYYTTPHYPMRDSRFCLGVNWRLYK